MGSSSWSQAPWHLSIRPKFSGQRLIEASYEETDKKLEDAIPIFRELREAFSEVAKQDTSPSLMEHTQQLYAGLTYGKGTLNETLLSGNSRGYKA